METSYTPVQYVYREIIDEEIAKHTTGKVFYFDQQGALEVAEGRIVKVEERNAGIFILMDSEVEIRVDRIITLFGRPAAAFDEYDAYANACMNCTGGDDI